MGKRVILIILDSLGVGELPDASFYGDQGSNTLAHIAEVAGLRLNLLKSFGLGCITETEQIPCPPKPIAAYGRMAELSPGKDTITGHWEIAGIVLDAPFPVYSGGFPDDIITPFEAAIGRKVLGNLKASGTEIIERMGLEHINSGSPIVYTSADSVFQIAAHESVVPLEQLYAWSLTARRLLCGEYAVGRVIARPFTGTPGSFQRTHNRKDYSLAPPRPTLLDVLSEQGQTVVGIGKIQDIFAGSGLTVSYNTKNNEDGMAKLLETMDNYYQGLIFVNLVDFDSVYGHRNDAEGYARALERFDEQLPLVLKKMDSNDVLFITADHGCDPTILHTDHTREYVPLLVHGASIRPVNLGTRTTFADLGATVASLLGTHKLDAGSDFSEELGL